jgi:hypothetical protein
VRSRRVVFGAIVHLVSSGALPRPVAALSEEGDEEGTKKKKKAKATFSKTSKIKGSEGTHASLINACLTDMSLDIVELIIASGSVVGNGNGLGDGELVRLLAQLDGDGGCDGIGHDVLVDLLLAELGGG